MHRTTGDNYALDSQGRRVFTAGPPPTTLDEGWANAVQEEIARAIEASGQTLAEGPGSDTMGQLAIAIQKVAAYNSIVYSQETFNAVWERTAANAYKLRDEIGSIYFKAYPGGYNMSGPSSPLSDGDTWGVFSTNNCTFVMCDGGNFFQMGDTPSYWSIATSNTVIYHMDVRGVGAVAAAVTRSIYIPAGVKKCLLLFISVSNRYSSAEHNVIYDVENNSTVFGCDISGMDGVGAVAFRGLYYIKKAMACTIRDSTFGGTGIFSAFANCSEIVECEILNIDAAGTFYGVTLTEQAAVVTINTCVSAGLFIGFFGCQQCVSASLYTVESTSGNCIGFSNCEKISACSADIFLASTENAYGFITCTSIVGSSVSSIVATAKNAIGFYDCNILSACKAGTIQTDVASASYKAVGFQDCDQLSACTADTIAASAANAYAYGFHTCKRLSACYAVTVTAVTDNRGYGYFTCTHMDGSCEAATVDDFEFYTCSQELFMGHVAAATPYGYTEVYNSTLIATGSTATYTPAKDCHLFGYVRAAGNYSYLSIRIGNNAKDVDLSINTTTNGPLFIPYSFPVKAGIPVYFAFSGTANAYHTLRYQPYGTTT